MPALKKFKTSTWWAVNSPYDGKAVEQKSAEDRPPSYNVRLVIRIATYRLASCERDVIPLIGCFHRKRPKIAYPQTICRCRERRTVMMRCRSIFRSKRRSNRLGILKIKKAHTLSLRKRPNGHHSPYNHILIQRNQRYNRSEAIVCV